MNEYRLKEIRKQIGNLHKEERDLILEKRIENNPNLVGKIFRIFYQNVNINHTHAFCYIHECDEFGNMTGTIVGMHRDDNFVSVHNIWGISNDDLRGEIVDEDRLDILKEIFSFYTSGFGLNIERLNTIGYQTLGKKY